MKIALVSPYDFAYPGGVVNHISCLEQQFTRMGHEVKILAPASKAVSSLGERFIQIGRPRPVPVSGSIARITLSPWLSSRVKTVLDRERFDLCHLHEPLMPMLCTTTLRLSQVPSVGTFHASGGKPWYSFGTPLGKVILRKWVRNLKGKIAVSSPALEYARGAFPGTYDVVPNGVDTRHFSPQVQPIGEFNDDKINIMFAGRLEKRKGLDYLLEAFRLVKPEIPNSRLIVVGPGERMRKKYQKRVRRQGLEDVVFVGYAAYRDLPRYYQTADIVCSPATGRESFGIVLLEAMAVAKPIVASDIQGYNGVVAHGADGLLVPPQNAERLAQALTSLMIDEPLRRQMGAKGRLKAEEYDWERVARQVMDVYLSVLNGSRPKDETIETEAILI
jgi:phosphatidylinositol alpha-mannosyltransferase